MNYSSVIEMDLRNLATEVKKKAPGIKDDAENGIETLLTLTKKHPNNIKKMRSTDYVTPFIDCLNNERVSEKAHEIALNGLNHVLSYDLASDATASTVVDILLDRLSSEELSSPFGSRIIQVFPVLLENSSYILPEKKMQCAVNHMVRVLCSEESDSIAYSTANLSLQQVLIALGKQVSVFCQENPKRTSTKVNDSIREKAPKSLGGQVYASCYWYILQDVCARIADDNAAWLSNGGDFESVRMNKECSIELLECLMNNSDIIINQRIEFSSIINYILIPTIISGVKEEKVESTLLVSYLRLLCIACSHYYEMIPAVDMVLKMYSTVLKKMTKKKIDEEKMVIVESLTMLMDKKDFFCYCCGHYSESMLSLFEQLYSFFSLCVEDIRSSSLIEAYASYSDRSFKGLSTISSNEEEEREETDRETMVVMILHCLNAVYQSSFTVITIFSKAYPYEWIHKWYCFTLTESAENKYMLERSSFFSLIQKGLKDMNTNYYALIAKKCDEELYSFLMKNMALLASLYGYVGLVKPQLSIVNTICRGCLPSTQASRDVTENLFSMKNIGCIEAIPLLCKEYSANMKGVWSLIIATMDCIEEYLPRKEESDSGYSPSSPYVFAEFEIIEEVAESTYKNVMEYEARGIMCVMELLKDSATQGIKSETLTGVSRLQYVWKEVKEEYEIEEKEEKADKTKPVLCYFSFLHLMKLLPSFLSSVPALMTPISELLTTVISELKRQPCLSMLTPPIMFFIGSLLEFINDANDKSASNSEEKTDVTAYVAIIPSLLKNVNTLLVGRITQANAVDCLYDIIINGDCLEGQWKPIITGLKKIASTTLCTEGFNSVYVLLDDFLAEMTFSEVLSLNALIASFIHQPYDINIALSAVGLYWKLVDYTLIQARESDGTQSKEYISRMRQEIIVTILPICQDNRPNIRNTAIQTLFQILIIHKGSFIYDDYLEVVESMTGLTSKLDSIRVNGYSEGDATPLEDEENIRRHHTRDTVEKQFNETYCYLLKGMNRLLHLFTDHLLYKVTGDAIAEYIKVYKTLLKFYCKCITIKEGKEVPCSVLTLYMEIISWVKKDIDTNSTAKALFSVMVTRLLNGMNEKDIGENTEADDVLLAIGNSLTTLLTDYTQYILDANDSYFNHYLSTIQGMIKVDTIAYKTMINVKYNTNRPKGKLNSIQKVLLQILQTMYEKMKENPVYLIDYSTYIDYIEGIKATANECNGNHSYDVFIVAIEEFQSTLMKRKHAKKLVKEYLDQQEEEKRKHMKKLLGNAVLEESELFNGISGENYAERKQKMEERLQKLDEMNDGDEAKSIVYYIMRNCSLLCVVLGNEKVSDMLCMIMRCMRTTINTLYKENDVEKYLFVDSAIDCLVSVSNNSIKDGDDHVNATIEQGEMQLIPTVVSICSFELLVSACKDIFMESHPLFTKEGLLSDLRKTVIKLLKLCQKDYPILKDSAYKEYDSMKKCLEAEIKLLSGCEDMAVRQEAENVIA